MIKKLILALTLVIMLTNTSCKARYPDLDDGLYAEFVTSKDTMVAKLFFEDVPTTVANFVALAEGKHPMVDEKYKGKPFYNGLTFHRVMNDFMIQGGDPLGTGIGDPGYKFGDEFRPHLKHDKPGILAMANSGPQSNGSQFYITEKATPWLDAFKPDGTLKKCGAFPGGSCHAVFGELVMGLDVQDEISNVDVDGRSKPKEDVIIKEVNIIRKGKAAVKFDAPKVFTEELPKIEDNMAEYTAQAEKAAAEAKKIAEQKAEIARTSFLENNANLKGKRIESKTGMAMIFTKKGNGKQPKATDRVFVDCAGYFENGELFWTTKKDVAKKNNKYDEQQDKRNMYKPFDRAYNENAGLIAGFKEAMLNMKIGDKARVFIPYYLGYGEKGSPPVIPPNSNLIFDIELVSIK